MPSITTARLTATKLCYLAFVLLVCCTSLYECRQQQQNRLNDGNSGRGNRGNRRSLELDSSNDSEGHGHRRGHGKKHPHHQHRQNQDDNGVSLWINEQQLNLLSGFSPPRMYAIENGHVLNDIRDTSMYKYIVIPSEVNYVNFTWKSGNRKFRYDFFRLETLDETILKAPTLSIKREGRIPQKEKTFSVFLPCAGNNSGTAMFDVGLSIENRRGKALPGTPLRINLKKECAHRGPDPECDLKCGNNGFCNHNKICQCKAGYTGQYCQTAFCFPQCMNGGNCTAPSVCTCPEGYQGTQCEGGICRDKCLNGGKCIQKDKCQCSKGYFGLHCEYSKCNIPCKNGGRCIGDNKCRCPNGLRGNHCEIGRKQRSTCRRPCKHGVCMPNKTCKCDHGFYGQYCNRRDRKHQNIDR